MKIYSITHNFTESDFSESDKGTAYCKIFNFQIISINPHMKLMGTKVNWAILDSMLEDYLTNKIEYFIKDIVAHYIQKNQRPDEGYIGEELTRKYNETYKKRLAKLIKRYNIGKSEFEKAIQGGAPETMQRLLRTMKELNLNDEQLLALLSIVEKKTGKKINEKDIRNLIKMEYEGKENKIKYVEVKRIKNISSKDKSNAYCIGLDKENKETPRYDVSYCKNEFYHKWVKGEEGVPLKSVDCRVRTANKTIYIIIIEKSISDNHEVFFKVSGITEIKGEYNVEPERNLVESLEDFKRELNNMSASVNQPVTTTPSEPSLFEDVGES